MDYPWLSEAHTLLAGLDRARGRLEAAEQRLSLAEGLLVGWPHCHWRVLCQIERALISHARGLDMAAEVRALEAYGAAQAVGADSWMGRSLQALRERVARAPLPARADP